ncbi:MAG: hypothetical protein P1Q69_06585 [Candidatus Thorarchaeota archaeon]|nr:hypothetical protein [Candidatus Thorarchaeota archaeon]
MSLYDNLDEVMLILGLESSVAQQSRIADILKTVLNLQLELKHPMSFAEIFSRVNRTQDKTEITRAWLHRLLKDLVEKGLVQIEDVSTKHRKYICDINSLIFGLRKMKSDAIEDYTGKIQEAKSTITRLQALNTNSVAQNLFENLTGQRGIPGSRYIKGMDEFHQVTNETIYDIAKEGDVIRSSVLDAGSFVGTADKRMGRLFKTATTGADIRYTVSFEAFQIKRENLNENTQEWILRFVTSLLKFQGKGLDFRILRPGVKRYQFVSLNDEVMALMIADDPVTAAWVTNEFNSDLIASAIDAFEEEWKSAIPIDKLNAKALSDLGVPKDNFIASVLENDKQDKQTFIEN